MQLSRDKILAAGLEILDSYGLGDMTMRRLATHLGVAPGALYWHFANKQALIEAIAREILAPVLGAGMGSDTMDQSTAPQKSAAQWCGQLRQALLSHRDGSEVVSAAVSMTPLHHELLEQLRIRLADLPPAAATDIEVGAATLLHFAMGATVLEQSARQAVASTGTAESAELGPQPGAADFNRGVEIILTGLAELPRR